MKSEEYPPSEDTFFLADQIKDRRGDRALDIGSGSGYLTRLLCDGYSFVVGTDINCSVLRNQTYKTQNLVCCSGSDALRKGFDLIVCNLPYLATDGVVDVATDGGAEGLEIPKRILDSACHSLGDNGVLVFVTSSLSNYSKLIDYIWELGLRAHITAKKKLFFEELILVEAGRSLL